MIGVLALVFAIRLDRRFFGWRVVIHNSRPKIVTWPIIYRCGLAIRRNTSPPKSSLNSTTTHVRQSNKALIMRSWPSSASSFCGGISRN